jgi:hypothetical protein
MSLLIGVIKFVLLLSVVTAVTLLGIAIGGLVAAFALLFLLLVGEGVWVWWKVSNRPPTSHLP